MSARLRNACSSVALAEKENKKPPVKSLGAYEFKNWVILFWDKMLRAGGVRYPI